MHKITLCKQAFHAYLVHGSQSQNEAAELRNPVVLTSFNNPSHLFVHANNVFILAQNDSLLTTQKDIFHSHSPLKYLSFILSTCSKWPYNQ